jgi:hypothetical protein
MNPQNKTMKTTLIYFCSYLPFVVYTIVFLQNKNPGSGIDQLPVLISGGLCLMGILVSQRLMKR